MLVDIQALEVEAGDLADAAPGALEQAVGEHRHLPGVVAQHAEVVVAGAARRPGDTPQQVQVGVELGDDVDGQRPALLLFDPPPGVGAADNERRAEGGQQPQLPCLPEHEGAILDDAGCPPGAVGLAG